MTGEEILAKLQYHITAGTYIDPKRNARQAKGQHTMLQEAMIKLVHAEKLERELRKKIAELWGWEKEGEKREQESGTGQGKQAGLGGAG